MHERTVWPPALRRGGGLGIGVVVIEQQSGHLGIPVLHPSSLGDAQAIETQPRDIVEETWAGDIDVFRHGRQFCDYQVPTEMADSTHDPPR